MGRKTNRRSELVWKLTLATAALGIAKVLLEIILKVMDLLDR